MLTDRELASLILVSCVALWVLSRPEGRAGLRSVLGAFLTPKISVPFLLYAAYVAIVVATFGGWSQLWEPRLLKDTIIWFAMSGAVLFFRFGEARKPGFVGARIRGALKVAVFLEFYINLVAYPLPWELALQVTAAVLSILSIVAATDPQTKGVGRVTAAVLGALGTALLLITGWQVVRDLATLDVVGTARDFLLPLWLIVVSVPFIYVLALWAHYETAFLRIDLTGPDQKAHRRAKLALLWGLGLRNPDVAQFGGAWLNELVLARTWRETVAKVREYRRWRAAAEAISQKAADDLVTYEGIAGTDEEGRLLDRREFAETIRVLESIGSAHMGWYRNAPRDRYKTKLADVMSAFTRGLPDDHGIHMHVRKDGRAWYAWRRAVTGWVFAIGASGPPPDQRFYDGPEPPDGYPGSDPAWSKPHERGPNWDLT